MGAIMKSDYIDESELKNAIGYMAEQLTEGEIKSILKYIRRIERLAYARGYESAKSKITKDIKRHERLYGDLMYCFTKDELVQQDYGYSCAKVDILKGLD